MTEPDWIQEKLQPSDIPWPLVREKAVLILMALQNDFILPDGKLAIPEAYEQRSKIKNMLNECRKINLPIIHVRQVFKPNVNLTPRLFEMIPPLAIGGLREGSKGAEIYSKFLPLSTEPVIEKMVFSGFHDTQLGKAILSLKRDTIILIGTVTNVCILSTAFGGFFRGFKILVVEDLCSSWDKELHHASIKIIQSVVGRVMSSEKVLEVLKKGNE